MRILLLTIALLSGVALVACDRDGSGSPDTKTSSTRETSATATPADHSFFGSVIQYESGGSGVITAEYLAPDGVTDAPAVLLLHQYGGSREQWAEFAPLLAREGYAVLVPDLDYAEADAADLFADVRAGLDYLKAQQGVDPGRAAIIGASYGANLAYVSSGLYPDLDTAIAISVDSRPDDEALVGNGLPDFKPRSVLFISDEAESPESTTLANTVDDPVGVKIQVGQAAHGGKSAHGVELLENELVIPQILEWLALRFAQPQ
jgi:dienelactone hydrolase